MKKLSQKQILILYLKQIFDGMIDKNNAWVRAWEMRGRETPYGFTGHQADKRLRELAIDGIIDRKINDDGYSCYRYKPQPVVIKTPEQMQDEKDKLLAEALR